MTFKRILNQIDKRPAKVDKADVKKTKSVLNSRFASSGSVKFIRPYRDIALLVVDVQRRYADPVFKERGSLKTERTAKHIAKLVPGFRALGIQPYFVYLFREDMAESANNPDDCCGGFYQVSPEPGDILVPKTGASAIDSSDIVQQLTEAGHKKLILVGFNASACIKSTALDAIKAGFEVCVLCDAVENDKENTKPKIIRLRTMQNKGVILSDSLYVLNQLSKRRLLF